MEGYVGQQFVGIDLHRCRSVIVRTTAAGEVLESVRIVNDADRLTQVMGRAGQAPEVVLEATYGWYPPGERSSNHRLASITTTWRDDTR